MPEALPPPLQCRSHSILNNYRNGKSDPIDAQAAARAVLAGEAVGEPKSGDGRVEMIRTLRSARRSAVKAHSQALQTSSRLCW
jgi:transposase